MRNPSALQREPGSVHIGGSCANGGRRWTASAATISDTDTLVIFKEGFDVPYGDGTQVLPPEVE